MQRTFVRPATTLAGAYALTADRAREIALACTGAPAGSTAAATRVAFPSGPYENSTCTAHARPALVPRIFERRGIL